MRTLSGILLLVGRDSNPSGNGAGKETPEDEEDAMSVPATLLRRWYVQGSLRNTPRGFTFALKNRLAPATVTKVIEVHAMGRVYGPEAIFIQRLPANGQGARWAHEITAKRPFVFAVNQTILVRVHGDPLPEGHHLITLELETAEVGPLRVPVEDEVKASVSPLASAARV